MNTVTKSNKVISRLFTALLILSGYFVFSRQGLCDEGASIDLYCFENAPYAVIAEVISIKYSVDVKGAESLEPYLVDIKIIDVLKGWPLPKTISVNFSFAPQGTGKKLIKGRKVLLFLGSSVEYSYIPILYGSVYFLEDSEIELWKDKIKRISSLLHDAIPSETLKEYGFYGSNGCKIVYKTSGGHAAFSGEVVISGNGMAKVEVKQIAIKEPVLVELSISPEYVKDLISTFARMDFFNMKYKENKMVMDAPWETVTYAYGKKSNTIEGYTETYVTNLKDYYFSQVSYKLAKLLTYVIENKESFSGKIYDFKDALSLNRSFESVKEKIDSGDLMQNFQNIIDCKEKAKLIPYLISKIDFKHNTFWVQGEARVNVVRLLRYLTQQDLEYDDKFLYNSNDEEIQKVKAAWESAWERSSKGEPVKK